MSFPSLSSALSSDMAVRLTSIAMSHRVTAVESNTLLYVGFIDRYLFWPLPVSGSSKLRRNIRVWPRSHPSYHVLFPTQVGGFSGETL
jgi:hypothetical protein